MSLTYRPDQLGDRAVDWPSRRRRTTHGILMDFVVDEVTTPQGTTMVRNYLEHPMAVGVIALDEQDRVAIEVQYRHPVRAKLVEAPAGLRDQPGETALATAQRELAEEVGLAASDWRILIDIYSSPGSSSQSTRLFLARGLTAVARPAGFELEAEEADMAVGWAKLDDLVAAVFAGRLMNPTIVSGTMALWTARQGGYLDALRPG